MAIDNKNPAKAEGRDKHVKERLAEISDADLDRVAGGIEAAAERDITKKGVEEHRSKSLQYLLDYRRSLKE